MTRATTNGQCWTVMAIPMSSAARPIRSNISIMPGPSNIINGTSTWWRTPTATRQSFIMSKISEAQTPMIGCAQPIRTTCDTASPIRPMQRPINLRWSLIPPRRPITAALMGNSDRTTRDLIHIHIPAILTNVLLPGHVTLAIVVAHPPIIVY